MSSLRDAPRPIMRPISDGRLTERERLRLLTDPRCEDGVHTEFLSRKERDYLALLCWQIDTGRIER